MVCATFHERAVWTLSLWLGPSHAHVEVGISVASVVMIGLGAFVLLAPALMVGVLVVGMSRRH